MRELRRTSGNLVRNRGATSVIKFELIPAVLVRLGLGVTLNTSLP